MRYGVADTTPSLGLCIFYTYFTHICAYFGLSLSQRISPLVAFDSRFFFIPSAAVLLPFNNLRCDLYIDFKLQTIATT